MCGGRGTRLVAEPEKPLLEIAGRPMVDRVRDALAESRVDRIYAVTSPNAPRTRKRVDGPVVDAPGDGYVADLQYALDRVEPPVLTVASDLPLLGGDAVDAVLSEYAARRGSLTVAVPTALKRALGVSVDTTMGTDGAERSPVGVNVVSNREPKHTYMTYDARFAVNVNRLSDARIAEVLS